MSIFGGMAVPSWNINNQHIIDPVNRSSWLFKIEFNQFF